MSKAFLVPVAKQLQGQAKQILRGAGLSLLKPKFFLIDSAKAAIEEESYQQSEQIGYDKVSDLFSTPVWDTLRLSCDAYIDESGATVPQTNLLFEIALIEISNPRNIVKTSVSGKNGTIKEYMSDGDYNIKIRAMLTSKYENRPPIEQLNNWKSITSSPISLGVECNFINNFGIYNLVIEVPSIKQKEGARNAWDIELDCVSDTPFEINA